MSGSGICEGCTWEEGLAQKELSCDTANGPDVDGCGVVCCSENELRGTVVAGADVGNVGLPSHQHLGRPKITQLELVGAGVHQQVLGLDVSMTHSHRMYVG